MNSWSRSSASEISMSAASASVRAMMTVGTPETSAASRAATRLRMCQLVGSSTLPPMCPHFFSGHDRDHPVDLAGAVGVVDLVGAQQRVVDGAHDVRDAVDRVQA